MNEQVEAIMDEKELPESEAAGLTEELAEESRASGTAIPVVAVGASAGGLDVFRRLLGDFPADTGFAIVFVQHLDPNHTACSPRFLGEPLPCRSVRRPTACRWKLTTYSSYPRTSI